MLLAENMNTASSPLRRILERHFYFAMAWVVLLVVCIGFGPNLGKRLLHAAPGRPALLWVHAAVFSGWVLLFIVQTGLVSLRKTAWHRQLGIAAGVLGCAIPPLGAGTAILMLRWSPDVDAGGLAFLSNSFNDMLAFALCFGLALVWRKRPEYHKRLMILATCALTGAAFARFPPSLVPDLFWYAGADLLIMLGVVRDLLVNRRVHPVYLFGLPAMAAGQALAMVLYLAAPAWWVACMRAIV